jgi:hypothetical protein
MPSAKLVLLLLRRSPSSLLPLQNQRQRHLSAERPLPPLLPAPMDASSSKTSVRAKMFED